MAAALAGTVATSAAAASTSGEQQLACVRRPGRAQAAGLRRCQPPKAGLRPAGSVCRQVSSQGRAPPWLQAFPEGAAVELDADDVVEIGRVSCAHGVRGEIKVIPSTDFPEERFMTPGVRYLRPPAAGRRKLGAPFIKANLVQGRMTLSKGRELWLVKFEEVRNKEEADALSKYTVFVSNEDRPQLEDDEVYVKDLVNMAVVLQETGETIGRVDDVYEGTGVYDTVRVVLAGEDENASESGGSFLIPFHAEMVEVDLDAGVMTINPPDGLLEATTKLPKAPKKPPTRRRRRKPTRSEPAEAGAAGAQLEAGQQT